MRITPIKSEKKVVVSFALTDAYDDAIRESIASGLRTTFSYDVALRVEAWVDRTWQRRSSGPAISTTT